MKLLNITGHQRNANLKPQWDTTIRPPELPKLKYSVCKDVEQLEFSYSTGGRVNQYNYFTKLFGSIYQDKTHI